MEGAYNGTQGFVNRETSIKRNTANLEMVLDAVQANGTHGLTWRELAEWLGLHHGQASGALSNLHKKGLVFVLRDNHREKCQVYIASNWRKTFQDAECIDEPAKVKNTRQLEALLQAVEQVCEHGSPMDILLLEVAYNQYKTIS